MRLNLGCGSDYRDGWVNVDLCHGDVEHDLNTYPYPFDDGSADKILLDNVLEHLQDPQRVVDECYRILTLGGELVVFVPYYNCAGAYNDHTHLHYFNRRSLELVFEQRDRYARQDKPPWASADVILHPTRLGRMVPHPIREKASMVVGEVYNLVEVRACK